jgi:hypothetical protein
MADGNEVSLLMAPVVASAKRKRRQQELYQRVVEAYQKWLVRNSSRSRHEKYDQFDVIFDTEVLQDEIDDLRPSRNHN